MKSLVFKTEIKEKLKTPIFISKLSNFIGISPQMLENWIDTNNIKLYSYPIVRYIATLFGCNIDDLFDKKI